MTRRLGIALWLVGLPFVACVQQGDRLGDLPPPTPPPPVSRPLLADSLRAGAPALRRTALTELDALLTDSLRAELSALADGEPVAAWLAEFWRRRDPTPGTPRNERREEHYRRLRHVLARFPAPGLPPYDLRGRDYLLFGPPDFRATAEGYVAIFYHPPREVWAWSGLEYLAEYWDFDLDGCYTKAGLAERGRNLDHVRGGFTEVTGEAPLAVMPAGGLLSLAWRGRYDEAVALRQDYAAPPAPLAAIPVRLFGYRFQGEGDSLRVALLYRLPIAALAWELGEGEHARRARVEHRLELLRLADGRAWEERKRWAFRATDAERREASGQRSAGSVFQLAAGRYRVDLDLWDLVGGAAGRFTRGLELRPFPVDSLALSDLLPLAAFSPGEFPDLDAPDGPLRPLPAARYAPGDSLRVYFEIYGLGVAEAAEYRLRYSIDALSAPAATGVAASLVELGRGERVSRQLEIALGDLEAGDYRLRIEVAAPASGRAAARDHRFEIVAPD